MTERDADLPLTLRVHDHGNAALEGVLRLIDEAARPRPLSEVLAALCTEVSAIVGCEIVSIYTRERAEVGESLRMAANVGFPAGAVSRVRVALGEGIVGHVAQTLRPVSLELATTDPHFVAFPELGEERYPIFLAVPLLVGRRAEAVLVLQRASERFAPDEVVLASALGTSFAYAFERARVRRDEAAPSSESRLARLEGRSVSSSVGLGRVETLPTFEGLAAIWRAREAESGRDQDDEVTGRTRRAAQVREAFEGLTRELARGRKRFAGASDERLVRGLESLSLLEADSRFLESLVEEAERSPDVPLALRKVARDYAQAPYRNAMKGQVQGWVTERSEEVEDFCLLLAARVTGERVPTGGSALLLPERLTGVVALTAMAHRSAAIAVGNGTPEGAIGPQVAGAAGIPTIVGVGGLFAWAREGDVVLVDADRGIVRVNPSATQIARFRQRGREQKAEGRGEDEGERG